LKEAAGGEVVAVSVGREEAIQTIRSALALGADLGILVKTEDVFQDSRITAKALRRTIEKDGRADLIFTGRQSVDSEGMQTHYRLGAALDIPVANAVVSFRLDGDRAVVAREVGGGEREVMALSLPCVIGHEKGLNQPRYPKLPDILEAKKKPVSEWTLCDLGIAETTGTARVMRLTPAPERGAAIEIIMLDNDGWTASANAMCTCIIAIVLIMLGMLHIVSKKTGQRPGGLVAEV
jgi:electron transfer flavoprotein beta subunit